MVPENLLEIQKYEGESYQPLIDYETWRVAVLRYTDELLPENLDSMQRHDDTDEVFVLLAGKCILFLGAGEAAVEAIYAQDMQPLKLYNVKKSAWHTHTLSRDATVLIVENKDTTGENSPQIPLNGDRKKEIVELVHSLWGAPAA